MHNDESKVVSLESTCISLHHYNKIKMVCVSHAHLLIAKRSQCHISVHRRKENAHNLCAETSCFVMDQKEVKLMCFHVWKQHMQEQR